MGIPVILFLSPQKCQGVFFPNLSKLITSAAAPLMLTPFVCNQVPGNSLSAEPRSRLTSACAYNDHQPPFLLGSAAVRPSLWSSSCSEGVRFLKVRLQVGTCSSCCKHAIPQSNGSLQEVSPPEDLGIVEVHKQGRMTTGHSV